MLRDVRYVFRMFRKGKGVTLVMILSLVIGVAASTVVFSVVNAFLFKPFATVSATLVLTGISCLAGYIPVRRAIRIDPNEALRYE